MNDTSSFSVFILPPLSAEFLDSSLDGLARVDEEKGMIFWSERINGHQFRRLREQTTGSEQHDKSWSYQLDAMIAEQEDGQHPVEGASGPATRWADVAAAQQEGLASETWVVFLERYREVVVRVIRKYGQGLAAIMEVPSFEGFLSWFCQTERLERISLRSKDGHVNAFRSWLYYQVRSYLKYCSGNSRKLEQRFEDLSSLAQAEDDFEPKISTRDLTDEQATALGKQALEELKLKDGDAYFAFVYRANDLSGVEIAALIGCSEAAVSRRFTRALEKIRSFIQQQVGEDTSAQDLLSIAGALLEISSEAQEPLT